MSNNKQQQLNITCGSDVVLNDRLIFDGETFDTNLSVGIAANLVNSMGKRTPLGVEVEDDHLVIDIPWMSGRLPGCYGLEVTGSCNSKRWSTYADSLIKYTKATRPGVGDVTVESDYYDITQEVGYRFAEGGNVDDVLVNGGSVVQNRKAQITIPKKVSELENDSDFATQDDVEESRISEVEATIDDNIGTPEVEATLDGHKLTLAFQNLLGDGIESIVQTTTSEESGGVNVFTVTTVGGKVATFQVKNGEKGDTVILGEGVVYTLYNSTGSNTDGAMTQKAVTDAIAADEVPTFESEKLVKSNGVYNQLLGITGLIDTGSTYNEKDSTNRVCVYYKIPDKNASYKIKVSDVELSDSTNYIVVAFRTDKTPYSATLLETIGSLIYDGESKEFIFSVPASIKNTAEYIAVTQISSNGTASFNVELSYEAIIDKKIAKESNNLRNNVICLDAVGNGMDYTFLDFNTIVGCKYIVAKPKIWTVDSIGSATDNVFAVRKKDGDSYVNVDVWKKNQFSSIPDFYEFVAEVDSYELFVRGDVDQHLPFQVYNVGDMSDITHLKENSLEVNQEVFYIDNGTTYNEKFSNTNRTCVFYPIKATADSVFEINVKNTTIPSGVSIIIAVTNDKSPYTASIVYIVSTVSESGRNERIKFKIPSQYINSAKYIAVFQNVSNSDLCQFDVFLSLKSSVIGRIENIEKNIGVVDNGTTYSDKFITDGGSATNRTCAFYPIKDINASYHIIISDTVVPEDCNIQVRITKGKTPYTSNPQNNVLQTVAVLENTGDGCDKIITIDNSIAPYANYIAICQNNANLDSCSFKVQLYYEDSIKDELTNIESTINNIPGVSGDIIPYNDSMFVKGRTVKFYNPYKDGGNNQYAGQLHCHSWAYATLNSTLYKVPLGYTVEQVAAMSEEDRAELEQSINTQFVQAHKTVGFDFMTITNYDNFADFTVAPESMPENFLWIGNAFEGNIGGWDNTAESMDKGAHMGVINTNFGKRFDGWSRQDLLAYCEERNCIVIYNHPFLNMLYSSPSFVKQIKKGLRFIEVYNGLGVTHADSGNIKYVKPGIMLDEDFDALISQGNFTFAVGVSDQRTLDTVSSALRNGCVRVFANSLTHKNIVDALLSGNFYAASLLDDAVKLNAVTITEGKYIVDTGMDNVVVEFVGKNNTILKTVTTTSNSGVAEYNILGTEGIVRARIYKLNNNQYNPNAWHSNKDWIIWTQPVFMADRLL